MRVLMISTDRNIFNPESAVHARIRAYSEQVEHLSVIVFSLHGHRLNPVIVSKNLALFPTSSWSRLLYVFDAFLLALREIFSTNSFGVDLITTQDPFETGLVGLLLARKFKKKLQVQIHTDLESPYFKSASLLNRIRVLIAHIVIPRANGLRTVSEKVKYSLEARYTLNAPVSVLPVFVDHERFKHQAQAHEFLHQKYPEFDLFLLAVGRLEAEKNMSFAIDAFASIAKLYPKLAFIIVGGGSLEGELRAQAQRLGLGDRIKFEGWVDNPSVYFQSADVFMHTSLYEGYGMALLEARVAGLTIITTNVGIAGELKGEGIGLCEIGDAKCFTWYLEVFLNQPDLRLRVHLNGPPGAETFFITKEEYVKRYIALWEATLAAGW